MARIKIVEKVREHPTMRKGKMMINGIEVSVNIPESVYEKLRREEKDEKNEKAK